MDEHTKRRSQFWLCLLSFYSFVEGQLYPYQGSTKMTISTPAYKLAVPMGSSFPFFGQKYDNFYISIDGLIGFSQHVRYANKEFSERHQKVANAEEDYPFVAPFYYGGVELNTALSSGKEYVGNVYFDRLTKPDSRAPTGELDNIGKYINEAIVGVRNFVPTYALLVTWENVTDQYETAIVQCTDEANKICKKNTFQAVLVTDGSSSFAIFNYLKMEISVTKYYQAGFNGGFGRGWVKALTKEQLQKANLLQGSNVTGRYLYQINQERIITGGCSDNRNQYARDLQVSPNHAGMLGGEMVEVSGPCFSINDRVMLRFGENGMSTMSEMCLVVNSMKVRCEVPILTQRGEVLVALSQNNEDYYYKTHVTIVHPSRMPRKGMLNLLDNGPTSRWNETNVSQLTLTWNPLLMSSNRMALVDINFIGYRETTKSEWRRIASLNNKQVPVGSRTFTFNVDDIVCNECISYEEGIVEVRLQDPKFAENRRAVKSNVITTGWLVNKGMEEKFGKNWPQAKCMEWYNKDKTDMSWINELEFCPCTLEQALADFGRWQKDMGCNIFTNSPTNCRFHSQAVHCARAVQPTRNIGAGNQCCYNNRGQLIYAADSFQGSTPDKSHDWGAAPYVRPGRVPSLSHGIKDVVTFYYCCLWSNYEDCDYYMDLRPTRDCTDYSPPKHAMVFGQGNVLTFDKAIYHMCGEGDFILLDSSDVTIEGRFLKSPFNKQYNNSVILTDVGIRVDKEIVEIRLKGPGLDRTDGSIDVIVNGKYQYFDSGSQIWKDFKETSIVKGDEDNSMTTNFTVLVKNGVGIQVMEENNILNLIVAVPPKFESQGLLGNWNNKISDEFIPRYNSTPVSSPLYNQFIFTWAIQSKDASIVPFPVLAKSQSKMCVLHDKYNSFCRNDKACNHDLWATGNRTLAAKTKEFMMWSENMEQSVQQVKTCGLLNVPRSIKDNFNYSLGSTVSITGCRKGQLSGDTKYSCDMKNGSMAKWVPEVNASCQEMVEDADIGMIVGIIVAVVVVLILIIVIGVICGKRRRSSSNKRDQSNPAHQSAPQYAIVATREPKSDREPGEKSEDRV